MALQEPLEKELNRLLQEGVIRESESPYRSGLIAIRKKDSSLRLVLNMKKLNERCEDDLYPLANPYDVLTKTAGKKFVSKIDLSKAFLQLKLSEDSQDYTSFSTYLGSYCFQRCVPGYKNGPRVMQRVIDRILRGTSSYANALPDDICIASYTFEDHLKHVR